MTGRPRLIPDCTGKRFGRLTVISETRKNNRLAGICSCECGSKLRPVVKLRALLNGNTRSCGCLRREIMTKKMFKHGHAQSAAKKTLTYISWRNMIQRVNSDRPKDFRWYKALGIKVCDRWQGSFGYQNFLNDLGERPSRSHSIDRIDSDKNYEPKNCKWSDKKEQARNRKVRS